MNKKFSTLVAVLLAAGAWTTLDAKVVAVANAKAQIGGSYLIGTAVDAEGGKMTNLLKSTASSEDGEQSVTSAENAWTFEAAGEVEGVPTFYLKSAAGTYLNAANSARTCSLGGKGGASIKFVLDGTEIHVAETPGESAGDIVATDELKLNENAAATIVVTGSDNNVAFAIYALDADDVTGSGSLSGFDLDVDADGKVILEAFDASKTYVAPVYFQTEDGYLTVNSDYAVKFLENKPTAAQSYNASWTLEEGKLVSVAAKAAKKDAKLTVVNTRAAGSVTYSLTAAGSAFTFGNGALTSADAANLTGTALYASASVNAEAAPASSIDVAGGAGNIVAGASAISKSVPSGYCVVALKNGLTTNYLKAGASYSIANSITAANTTDYEKYLWSVSKKEVNNTLYYTFTSLAKNGDDPIVWTVGGETAFVANEAYSGRGITLATTANPIQVDGTEGTSTTAVIGLYDAFELAKTQEQLDAIYNPGFEMTVKITKDGKEVIEDIDVFGKKMYPIGASATATSVELWDNADKDAKGAKVLVLDVTEKVGLEEGSPVVGQFKWITKSELGGKNSDNYESDFSFRYSATSGNPETDAIKEVVVGNLGSLYILKVADKYYLTVNKSVDAKTAMPYVKLGASNVYDVKKLLGQYLSFAYADTKANTPDAEQYKLNTLLTAVYDANTKKVVADFALGSGTSLPEAQWAVTAADLDQNTVTLTNRENTAVTIKGVMFRAEGNKFVMTTSGTTNVSSDLVTMTALSVDKAINFDGYMQTTPNVLRNEDFYLGQYHAIEGNNNAYFVENHTEAGSHQIGMTAEKENAQKWNLHFAMKQDDDQKYTLVDTVKVPLTFATLKDGKIITAGDDAVKDTLFILPYAFQNASNREFVSYKTGKGFEFYFCNKDEKEDQDVNDAAVIKFALKMKPDNTYNFVEISNDALSANKVLAGNSANKGILSRTGTYVYDQNENSLMVVEKADAPEYHKIAMAWGDTIQLFREENESQVVYEKRDAKSVVEKDTLSFLNIDNINQFKVNPAIFADTAYINRVDANGELNTCYQYLLAVNVDPEKSYYCPYNPEHNTDEWRKEHNGPCADAKEHRAVAGRYLINLIDTANVYGATHLHNNPYINNIETAEDMAKLSFVEGIHIGDTLIVTRKGGEVVKLRMDTPDFNVAKFAFRYVDSAAKTFKIQTQHKPYAPGTDADEIDDQATNNGYLKWVNGTLAVTGSFENGDVFGIEENYEGNPVANEDITTSSISVIASEGKVIINGAAGKKVTISNVLGQTIANTVLSSDNATISAPAGVVVVAIEGEAAVKAIVK
ncbi:DUF6383 domain-containing protein [Parabacteroides gordonii]|jgi:hypothetical protein|uniref:DUF6383 domain-containing protein n=1 Tax=Parabacteroides gordonii TaxID=574930 RepID=UPI00241E04BF|nr:DUF6383 domain-containing protein [Parabacteroides gordonii]